MGSHGVTCHLAEVTFPPLPQPKLVLDLATPEGCKAELTCNITGSLQHNKRICTVAQIADVAATPAMDVKYFQPL